MGVARRGNSWTEIRASAAQPDSQSLRVSAQHRGWCQTESCFAKCFGVSCISIQHTFKSVLGVWNYWVLQFHINLAPGNLFVYMWHQATHLCHSEACWYILPIGIVVTGGKNIICLLLNTYKYYISLIYSIHKYSVTGKWYFCLLLKAHAIWSIVVQLLGKFWVSLLHLNLALARW